MIVYFYLLPRTLNMYPPLWHFFPLVFSLIASPHVRSPLFLPLVEPMRILSCNCQGIGSRIASYHLNKLCISYKLEFLFLSEIRCNNDKVSKIIKSCGFSSYTLVSLLGLFGGLGLAWSDSMKVDILRKSQRITQYLYFLKGFRKEFMINYNI